MSKTKRTGRPVGSKNRDYQESVALPSVCKQCNSTERETLGNPQEVESCGTRPDGTEYNTVINRRVRCTQCGQHRIEKTYENQSK